MLVIELCLCFAMFVPDQLELSIGADVIIEFIDAMPRRGTGKRLTQCLCEWAEDPTIPRK